MALQDPLPRPYLLVPQPALLLRLDRVLLLNLLPLLNLALALLLALVLLLASPAEDPPGR